MRQNSLSTEKNNFCVSLSEIWMRERERENKILKEHKEKEEREN